MGDMNNERTIDLIINNEKVLECMEVQVTFDNGDNIKLNISDAVEEEKRTPFSNCKEIRYEFKDEEESVFLSLVFKEYKDILFAYIDAKVINKRVIHRHKHFAPEGGIVIKVGNSGDMDGLMALYRHKDWWTRPYFEKDLTNLPDRTQSLLWRSSDNFYYIVPVVDKIFKTDFGGNGKSMDIRVSSYAGGYDSCKALVFAAAVGKEPFKLSKRTVQRTLEELGFPTFSREHKRYPEILDYLGWCSWDAFYHQVSEECLLEKASELNDKKLPVKWIMIDDGWLDVKNEGLVSFDANKEKFPNGLKSVSKKLKEQYGVKWVGVWHAFMGYWGGINPDSDLAKVMNKYIYRTNTNKLIPYPEAGKGFGFWDAWYSSLRKERIDFVKVDGQSAINNFLMYNEPVGKSVREAHKALEAAAGIHFDNCIINCMGMALENIWSRPVSSVSRNSDDFVPSGEISFKEHALQNAYNSYFHGNFYWGDWDMFWTNHDEGIQNSVLRAVSGGPVYFSDRLGDTSPEVIWPLILNSGKILRGDRPGLPTEDCLFKNPNEEAVPLKVWNTIGYHGIIAAFNINLESKKVKGYISPSDIPEMRDQNYLVYDYFNKEVIVLKFNERHLFELNKNEAALFVIVPYSRDFIPIGLVNKYLAPAAINNCYISGSKRFVSLVQGGLFAFVSDKRVIKVSVEGKETDVIRKDNNLYIIDCSEYKEQLNVEIDVE